MAPLSVAAPAPYYPHATIANDWRFANRVDGVEQHGHAISEATVVELREFLRRQS